MKTYNINITTNGKTDYIAIEGCKSIEKYSSDCVCVKLHSRAISILGTSLSLPVFSEGRLLINGNVKNITIQAGDK